MPKGVSPYAVLLEPGVVRGCCGFLTEKSPQARGVMTAMGMAGLGLAGYWLFTGCKLGILWNINSSYLLLLDLAGGLRGCPVGVAQLQHLCCCFD